MLINRVLDTLKLDLALVGKAGEFDAVKNALLREGVLKVYREVDELDAYAGYEEQEEGGRS